MITDTLMAAATKTKASDRQLAVITPLHPEFLGLYLEDIDQLVVIVATEDYKRSPATLTERATMLIYQSDMCDHRQPVLCIPFGTAEAAIQALKGFRYDQEPEYDLRDRKYDKIDID